MQKAVLRGKMFSRKYTHTNARARTHARTNTHAHRCFWYPRPTRLCHIFHGHAFWLEVVNSLMNLPHGDFEMFYVDGAVINNLCGCVCMYVCMYACMYVMLSCFMSMARSSITCAGVTVYVCMYMYACIYCYNLCECDSSCMYVRMYVLACKSCYSLCTNEGVSIDWKRPELAKMSKKWKKRSLALVFFGSTWTQSALISYLQPP